MLKRSKDVQQPLSEKILGNGEEVLREKLDIANEKIENLKNSPYTNKTFVLMLKDIENKEYFLDAAQSHLSESIYAEAKQLIDERRSTVESYKNQVTMVEEKIVKLEGIKEHIRTLLREIEKNKKREAYLLDKGTYGTSIFLNNTAMDDDFEILESEIIGQVKEIERKNKMLNHTIDAYEDLGKGQHG